MTEAGRPLGRRGGRPRGEEIRRESLRVVIESNLDGMVVIDRGGEVVFANPAAEGLLARSAEQLVGMRFGFPHAPGEASEIEMVAGGAVRVAEMRVVEIEWEGTPAFLASLRDITERKRAEEASLRLAAVVEQSDDAIFAFDGDGLITAWNQGAERLLGHRAADALAQPVTMLAAAHRAGEEREILRRVLAGEAVTYEAEYVCADSTLVEVSVIASPIRTIGAAPIAGSVIARDITVRRAQDRRLEHLATRDPLTGLLNRRAFEAALAGAVAFARRYEIGAVLLILDVDHFKYINDSYGHAVGDATLRHIADMLRRRLRETDVVGRPGGDELALVLPGTAPDQGRTVAQSLLEELREDSTLQHNGQVVRLTASVGLVAIEHDSRLTPDELLAHADIALYEAKEAGRDRIAVADFSAHHEPAFMSRLGWSARVREALEHERFVLHAQPIVNLRGMTVERAELLIRMRADGSELVLPGSFLPVAERFGQIQAIDRWVIGHTLGLLRTRAEPAILHLNISGVTMGDPELIDAIPELIAGGTTEPGRLAFEITETAAIENLGGAQELADRLSSLGCRIVLDDFGSGFGSFYYLKHLPFDSLKIDGEFIKQITSSKSDRVTVQAIIEMARGLDKTTIAECVEDQATLDLVRDLGIDYAQGFQLGSPAPIAEGEG